MNDQDRALLKDINERLRALETVRNVSFIEVLKRNALGRTVQMGATTSAASITEAVRNAADSGSTDVAKVPDGKTAFQLPDGTIKYLATYNS